LAAASAALMFSAFVGIAAPASATIMFATGNNSQPNELAVAFINGDTGATITGTTGAGNPNVLFTSLTSETLTVQGQHIQNNAGGNLTSLNATVPGFQLADFIFGLHTLNRNATVKVTDNHGTISSFTLPGGQATNF